jgi:glycosyltransferase involved in cell wall biosynthesis
MTTTRDSHSRASAVGLVHDYLLTLRGAERVFSDIAGCWPTAPIYTSMYSETGTAGRFASRDIHTSWLQHTHLGQDHFRYLYPLYPSAIERISMERHELVISSSSAFAHGVRVQPGAVHVCACHTPFRYLWYEREIALGLSPRPLRPALAKMLERNRRWDLDAAARVDHYIALSTLAKSRINELYGRAARVVLPGIELDRFSPGEPEDFFLVVGALVPHKRVDRALDAARMAGLPITVVGEGPELPALKRRFGGTATFLGRIGDPELARIYARARALVIPNVEEFGLTSLESQASGRPVLAIDAGGARDTVIDGETGVLVGADVPNGLAEAMRHVDFDRFDRARIRRHAESFSATGFRSRFATEVERLRAL